MLSELPVRCRDVVDELIDPSTVVNLAHRHHLERCEACRADLAALRTLRDDLRALASQAVDSPTDLLASITARLDAEDAAPLRRAARMVHLAPYVGGVVAATAAGALLAGRRRLRTV